MTVDYGKLSDLNVFVENFQILLHVWNVITSSNSHKLSGKAKSELF